MEWRYEGTIVDWAPPSLRLCPRSAIPRSVGVPPRQGVSRFTILSRFFVIMDFLFCKLPEHYSQTNFPIIKTKPFKVTKYKNVWQIFRPKWVKIKIFVIILSLLLKNENKDTHYKYT